MKRRAFLQKGTLASISAMTLGTSAFAQKNASSTSVDDILIGTSAQPQPVFNMDYAPHEGMFGNHAKGILDQIRFMHDQGFRSIEDNGMFNRSVEEQNAMAALLSKLNMRQGVFVIDGGENWKVSLTTGKKEHLEVFLKACHKAVEVGKRVNAKWATVVPGFFARNLPIGIQTGHVIDALRRGSEILEKSGLVMVLEPLSDTPDLFLRTSEQTYMICRAVNSPSCKILYDIYHMQKNEGHILENIDLCYDEIAYFQIGDNPGRKEPGTGEINYRNVFRHIHNKGYKGIMGMEHGKAHNGKEGEIALIKAYREADKFL
jgi:hydroxypyruvate isomerase